MYILAQQQLFFYMVFFNPDYKGNTACQDGGMIRAA
jgi:hypothetical protein